MDYNSTYIYNTLYNNKISLKIREISNYSEWMENFDFDDVLQSQYFEQFFLLHVINARF